MRREQPEVLKQIAGNLYQAGQNLNGIRVQQRRRKQKSAASGGGGGKKRRVSGVGAAASRAVLTNTELTSQHAIHEQLRLDDMDMPVGLPPLAPS